MAAPVLMYGSECVSYTHLDVYKRQDVGSPPHGQRKTVVTM